MSTIYFGNYLEWAMTIETLGEKLAGRAEAEALVGFEAAEVATFKALLRKALWGRTE